MKIRHLLNTLAEGNIYANIKRQKWLYFVVIVVCIVCFTCLWFKSMLNPKDSMSEAVVSFEVKKGATARQLAKQMLDEELINNTLVFKIYARLNKLDAKIKSGNYLLSPAMSTAEILEVLVSGDFCNNDVKITIPEGSSLENIAYLFDKNNLVTKDIFLEHAFVERFKDKHAFLNELPSEATLEGFLFPDTYYMPKDKEPDYYIDILLNRFQEVYFNKVEPLMKENPELDLYELVTLASIVEAEAQLDEERSIIAGVFFNRLKKGMALQSCATVGFTLGEHKEVLSLEDLEVDSPYNTYMYSGLPPGPIGAPGLSSMMAAADPAKTDYLYFVAKGDGSHIFNITFDEHLKAQKEIQKMR